MQASVQNIDLREAIWEFWLFRANCERNMRGRFVIHLRWSYDETSVMNPVNLRDRIFRDEANRQRFLEALAEAGAKTQWEVHAYCLMRQPT